MIKSDYKTCNTEPIEFLSILFANSTHQPMELHQSEISSTTEEIVSAAREDAVNHILSLKASITEKVASDEPLKNKI